LSGEKTEAPSQRRLEKSREDGRSPISREFSMLASLAAGVLVVAWQVDPPGIANWLAFGLRQTSFQGPQTFAWVSRSLGGALLPPALAAACGYAGATLLQSGFLFHATAWQPDISRISPLAGVKRLFSSQTLVQLLKSLAKLGVLGFCLVVAIRRALPILPASPALPPGYILRQIATQSRGLVLLLLGAQTVIAGADFAWERFHHYRELRMSLQELKDEHKDQEGNPQIKQRLRQLARSRARRRMMAAVPKASVIITNPTHYAVALVYDRGSKGAPRLVAKGADEVAARIRDLAREHRIPIVANAPLARALFRVDIDTEIPSEHFRAVAEVIAFIWRMRGKARL
jgi:flagellar biosynthetic protein FlhB